MRYTETYLKDLLLVDTVKSIESLQNCSILLTGATGLIGSCLADMLLSLNERMGQGIEIWLTSRDTMRIRQRFRRWSDNTYVPIAYDVSSPIPSIMMRHFDYVVHCASNAHPAAYATQPVETAMSNVLGTASLLRLSHEQDVRRMLYVSSSEVYGSRIGEEKPYSEDELFRVSLDDPRSCYPCSKRLCENLCACFSSEYDVNTVIVRPGHIYGPTMTSSDSRAHAQFARNASLGNDIVMKSAGNQLRSYTYVVDCCTAILSVLLNGVSGEVYNISNRDAIVTIRELAGAFADAGGVQVRFEMPSDAELAGYNRMSCSALTSEKLENLGWHGLFSVRTGAKRTIEAL